MDFAYASAAELAGLIRSRAVSPVEVVRTALERMERSQHGLNAFITIAADAAMEQARVAEKGVMHGATLGPLHGSPERMSSCCAWLLLSSARGLGHSISIGGIAHS